MKEYSIFFPPPEEIFKKYEPPVVKFEDPFLFCYGEAGLENWLQKTFGMKPYEPKVSDEKIRKTIEDIIKEKGIDNVELKRVLIDKL